MTDEQDLSRLDLYSIFNSSGSVKQSFNSSPQQDEPCSSSFQHTQSFSSDTDLLLVPEPSYPGQCHICSEKYETNYGTWDHSRDHAWVCSECDFTTDKKSRLVEHQLEAAHPGVDVPEGKYFIFCLICNQRVTTSSNLDAILLLKKHKQQCHHEAYPSYFCRICDFATFQTSAYTLIEHEKQCHPNPETFNQRHYQCNVCKRLLESRAAQMHHKRTHTKKHRERNTPYKKYKAVNHNSNPLENQPSTSDAGEFVCISDYSTGKSYYHTNDQAYQSGQSLEHNQPYHQSLEYPLAESMLELQNQPFASVPMAKCSVYNTENPSLTQGYQSSEHVPHAEKMPDFQHLPLDAQPDNPSSSPDLETPSNSVEEPRTDPPIDVSSDDSATDYQLPQADKCHICSEKYEPNYGIWDHSQDHAWTCGECDFTTDKITSLRNHKFAEVHPGLHHPPGTYHFFCLICNKRHTTDSVQGPFTNLTKHLMQAHLNLYPVYSCNLCDFKTNKTTNLALLEHEKQFHPESEMAGTDNKRHYMCGECPRLCVSTTSTQKHRGSHLIKEQRITMMEQYANTIKSLKRKGGLICTVCKAKRKTKHAFRVHYMEEHGDHESAHLCRRCNNWFVTERKLVIHLGRAHTMSEKDIYITLKKAKENRNSKTVKPISKPASICKQNYPARHILPISRSNMNNEQRNPRTPMDMMSDSDPRNSNITNSSQQIPGNSNVKVQTETERRQSEASDRRSNARVPLNMMRNDNNQAHPQRDIQQPFMLSSFLRT